MTSLPEAQLLHMAASVSPVELALPPAFSKNAVFRAFARFRLRCANLLPGLCAYQHLALIRKQTPEPGTPR